MTIVWDGSDAVTRGVEGVRPARVQRFIAQGAKDAVGDTRAARSVEPADRSDGSVTSVVTDVREATAATVATASGGGRLDVVRAT